MLLCNATLIGGIFFIYRMENIMWSWHWFCGCHFGFEWYEADKKDPYYEESRISKFSYFIIDLGFLRVQRCEKI